MNGVHDMGGMQIYGPILREHNEPYFHEQWEERVFGLFFGCFAGGHFNVDMFRAEIEKMPGADYLRTSYYEHWLHAIESLLLTNGTLTHQDIAEACRRGAEVRERPAPKNALPIEMVPGLIATGASTRMNEAIAPRFKPGDAIRAKDMNPVTHNRIPRYIKGRRGVVQRDHGVFSFNDTVAHGLGHQPQHAYSVRFMARDLWGEQANANDSVCIDLFETYMDLEPAATPKKGRSRE